MQQKSSVGQSDSKENSYYTCSSNNTKIGFQDSMRLPLGQEYDSHGSTCMAFQQDIVVPVYTLAKSFTI